MATNLKHVPGRYAVTQLPSDAPLPPWVPGPGLWAVVAAEDETTCICLQNRVPDSVTATKDWACLRTIGPFPFDESGVVRNLISPLADNDIGVFVVCTYDGEHVLISETDFAASQRILTEAGYTFDA